MPAVGGSVAQGEGKYAGFFVDLAAVGNEGKGVEAFDRGKEA